MLIKASISHKGTRPPEIPVNEDLGCSIAARQAPTPHVLLRAATVAKIELFCRVRPSRCRLLDCDTSMSRQAESMRYQKTQRANLLQPDGTA